jgi:hypothetical protein
LHLANVVLTRQVVTYKEAYVESGLHLIMFFLY